MEELQGQSPVLAEMPVQPKKFDLVRWVSENPWPAIFSVAVALGLVCVAIEQIKGSTYLVQTSEGGIARCSGVMSANGVYKIMQGLGERTEPPSTIIWVDYEENNTSRGPAFLSSLIPSVLTGDDVCVDMGE